MGKSGRGCFLACPHSKGRSPLSVCLLLWYSLKERRLPEQETPVPERTGGGRSNLTVDTARGNDIEFSQEKRAQRPRGRKERLWNPSSDRIGAGKRNMSRTSTRGCIRRNTAGGRNSSDTPSRSPGILPRRNETAGKSCSSRSKTAVRWGASCSAPRTTRTSASSGSSRSKRTAAVRGSARPCSGPWTADAVTDALRKYEALGFRVTETKENRTWRPDGEAVVEIKMEKELG